MSIVDVLRVLAVGSQSQVMAAMAAGGSDWRLEIPIVPSAGVRAVVRAAIVRAAPARFVDAADIQGIAQALVGTAERVDLVALDIPIREGQLLIRAALGEWYLYRLFAPVPAAILEARLFGWLVRTAGSSGGDVDRMLAEAEAEVEGSAGGAAYLQTFLDVPVPSVPSARLMPGSILEPSTTAGRAICAYLTRRDREFAELARFVTEEDALLFAKTAYEMLRVAVRVRIPRSVDRRDVIRYLMTAERSRPSTLELNIVAAEALARFALGESGLTRRIGSQIVLDTAMIVAANIVDEMKMTAVQIADLVARAEQLIT